MLCQKRNLSHLIKLSDIIGRNDDGMAPPLLSGHFKEL